MKLTPHERNEINILRVTQMIENGDNLLQITPELTPHLYKHLNETFKKDELIQLIMQELLGEEISLEEIVEVSDPQVFTELSKELTPQTEEGGEEEEGFELELFTTGDSSNLGSETSLADLDNLANLADEAVFPLLETELLELAALKVVCDSFFQALTTIYTNEALALHSLLFNEDKSMKHKYIAKINEIWDGESSEEVL